MKAQAVTGQTGLQLVGGLDIHDIKYSPQKLISSDIWREPSPKDAGCKRLGALFGDKSPYDRLSHWLMNHGVSPTQKVIFGKLAKPPMRFIIDGRDHYREIKNKIYHKKI